MKKEYISLEIELFFLNNQDVITASDWQADNDIVGSDIFDD
jgi:hypothetical protein